MNERDLLTELDRLKAIMVSVSNGGPKIQSVNGQYQEMYIVTDEQLRTRDIPNENPHTDLWSWYSRWRQDDLPTYASRRDYLAEMYSPMISAVRAMADGTRIAPSEETGWVRVDRVVRQLQFRLIEAENEEDFQAVGLLCREAIISLAQSVYNPEIHATVDGVEPSITDAKRMLEAYIAHILPGSHNATSRKHARASFDLANELQHRRTAKFRLAAMCAEATTSTVNLIAIIAGVRDPVMD